MEGDENPVMNSTGLIHPFESDHGSTRITRPGVLVTVFLGNALILAAAAKMGLLGIGMVLGVLALTGFLMIIFNHPIVGLYTAVFLSFILIGVARYVKDVQTGLGMDGILVLTYVAMFMKRFREGHDWRPMNRDVTWLALVWCAYSIFQLVNPEARSTAAWFSGRSVGLYMLLIVPLTLYFMDTRKKLVWFLVIWGACSLLASLKGIMQVKFGVDAGEQGWLNEGNYKTHVLFGKLRAFSFLSDAGQFGANQAYSAVVMLITSFAMKERGKKIFFLTVALFAFYGMIISGTRGALSLPLASFVLYLVLRKNVVVLAAGGIVLFAVFFFFKFTTIGQGNADIRRMRTAFDPNDASLQVRLNNQKILKGYMASRPFGGGIGHGGVKAQRFLPNAYLSQIPTDSWYVLIWVEQGIVGLVMHLAILFYILIKACYLIFVRIRDPQLKMMLSALVAGYFGVMVCSYGNAVLGQMPTNVLVYVSMAILLSAEKFDLQNLKSIKTT